MSDFRVGYTFGYAVGYTVGYTVVEWYKLPPQTKGEENEKDYSYHQMRMEEFWNDK